jgi:hypothetical protein
MALHWNITNCSDFDGITAEGKEWGITNSLIWATMSVDMHEITETNYVEFYARLKAVEATFGAICYGDDGDYFLTIEDVKKRIGLVTNASTKTISQFFKRIEKQVKQELANA